MYRDPRGAAGFLDYVELGRNEPPPLIERFSKRSKTSTLNIFDEHSLDPTRSDNNLLFVPSPHPSKVSPSNSKVFPSPTVRLAPIVEPEPKRGMLCF